MAPEDCCNELEEGNDMERTELGASWLAVEEQVEELEPNRVTLNIQSLVCHY